MAIEHGRAGLGSVVTGRVSRVSWLTGIVLAVLAANVALVAAGPGGCS